MKNIILTAAAVLALATSASAADLPRKSVAPVIVAPAFTWTGFYIGGHVGGILGSNANFTRAYAGANAAAVQGPGFNAPTLTKYNGDNGTLFGGQVGYNYQLSSALVVGVEVDYSITDYKQSNYKNGSGASFFNNFTDRSMDWFGTARARIGYLVAPSFMVYATGGVAMGKTMFRDIVGYPVGGVTLTGAESSKNKTGYTFGAGVEYAITNNWTVKGEYLYYDLGTTTLFNPGFGPGFPVSYTTRTTHVGNIGKIGVNYKF
jgi:outer membrane immunogenic protein